MAMPKSKDPAALRKVPNAIIGEAQTVLDKVVSMHFPHRTTDFLLLGLRKGTFDVYGFHQRDGTDEHSCLFHLATWARNLGWPKPNVLQVRDRLVKAHVIWFIPDPDEPGYGRIGWNMRLDEWEDIGPKGGKREGAGNPFFVEPEYQALITRLKAKRRAEDEHIIYQSSNGDLSKKKCFPALPSIKVVTADCLEDAGDPVSPQPQEEVTKERSKKEAKASSSPKGSGDKEKALLPEDSLFVQQAYHLRATIKGYLPGAIVPEETVKAIQGWAREFRLMAERDHRTPEQIDQVIAYLNVDTFWQPNILSGAKLREKFDTLLLRSNQRRSYHGNHTTTASPRRSVSAPLQAKTGPYSDRDDELD